MEELKIYKYQAEDIEDCFRLVARYMKSYDKKTSVDRDIMQCWQTIKNVLAKEPDKRVSRL